MRHETSHQRSQMMSSIRSRDTAPEMALRLRLHAMGFRYRLNVRRLPGSPDIVMSKYRAAIFVHGCFWHRHADCKFTTTPKANAQFWREKFQKNVERDQRDIDALRKEGWRVAVVWECATKFSADITAHAVAEWLGGHEPMLELGAADLQASSTPNGADHS
ncbi:DNA mismatch endonuclease Vsr [Diaphorobacter sp. HDW4B]|nr:DNA mismatch endonuclease Vsr [Diaphorobacter sp. HDW4B]